MLLRFEHCALVVITGGEPFRQNIAPLVEQLLELDLRVQIETNGTLWVDLPVHENLFIVCSPKTATLHPQIVSRISAYKYVLAHNEISLQDGLPSYSTQTPGISAAIAQPSRGAEVFVMPMDTGETETSELNVKATVESALRFGHRFTLQTHKVIGVP